VADDFDTLHEPECNIVAFRYLPPQIRAAPPGQIDQLQWRLRRAVVESGEFYIVQSRLDGRPVLRTTVMNPLTGLDIVRTELVMDIIVEDGAVSLTVDLPSNHLFANNIREEIDEKVGHLWDVKEVKVKFNDPV
jgi:glutamate/tyrosine decarboxylase-like PLP-dependent enzyme